MANFNHYWHKEAASLSTRDVYASQRSFLLSLINEEPCKGDGHARSFKRHYYLKKGDKKVKVCKPFFEATLDVKPRVIQHLMEKARDSPTPVSDLRGRHKPGNTLNKERVRYVKDHINSFPTVESHYCRSSTKRQYLARNLSVQKMFELYKRRCAQDGETPVAVHMYRKIFNTGYNLGFHRPKKDQCTQCIKHKTLGPSATDEENAEFEKHV